MENNKKTLQRKARPSHVSAAFIKPFTFWTFQKNNKDA